MLIPLALVFVLVHGPKGHEFRINTEEISSISEPTSKEHFSPGTHCLIRMTNGKFFMVRETCTHVLDEIEKARQKK